MAVSLVIVLAFLACLQTLVLPSMAHTAADETSYDRFSKLAKKVEFLEQPLLQKIKASLNGAVKDAATLHKVGRRGDNRFGFTARLTYDLTGLHPQQFIVFDKVTSNLGNTYNSSTGIYTCALTGNYFFSATVAATYNSETVAAISVNGIKVAWMYSRNEDRVVNQGSNSAMAHCNQGDQVAVQVVKGYNVAGDINAPPSSFTGFLIWDD